MLSIVKTPVAFICCEFESVAQHVLQQTVRQIHKCHQIEKKNKNLIFTTNLQQIKVVQFWPIPPFPRLYVLT